MAQTAADVLVVGIIGWGVDTVFGIPGEALAKGQPAGGRLALTLFRDKPSELF